MFFGWDQRASRYHCVASDGASSGCPFKNGYKSLVKCAESCLVPLLENLPPMSWEKAFLGSGNLCLKCGGEKRRSAFFFFFHKSWLHLGVFRIQLLDSGFYFPGLGIEPKVQHMLRSPSALSYTQSQSSMLHRYGLRPWRLAIIVDQALRTLVSLWAYLRSWVRER